MQSLLFGVALLQQLCTASQARIAQIEQRFIEEDLVEFSPRTERSRLSLDGGIGDRPSAAQIGDMRRRLFADWPRNEQYVRVPFWKFSDAAGDYVKIVRNEATCNELCYNEWASDQSWVLDDMFYIFTDAKGHGQCTCRVAFTYLNGHRTHRNQALNQATIQLYMDETENHEMMGCGGGSPFASLEKGSSGGTPSSGSVQARPCGALKREYDCMFNSNCTWLTRREKCVRRRKKGRRPGRRRLQGYSPDESVGACCGGGGGGW